MADYPTTPGIKSATVTGEQPISRTIADDGSSQVRVIGAHRWSIKVTHAPATKAQYLSLDSFIMKQRGRLNSFTITLPDRAAPLGEADNTAFVVGDYAATATDIEVDPGSATLNPAYAAGDVIKFNGHTKVYVAAADSTNIIEYLLDGNGDNVLDGNGDDIILKEQVNLTIAPPLQNSIANSELIYNTNVEYTVKLSKDRHSYTVNPGYIYEKTVDLIEVLN